MSIPNLDSQRVPEENDASQTPVFSEIVSWSVDCPAWPILPFAPK